MNKNKRKIILAIAITAFIVLGLCGVLIIKNNPISQKHIPVTATYHIGDEIDDSQYTFFYMNQTVASFLPPAVPTWGHSKPVVQYDLGSNQTLLLNNYLYNVVSYDVAGQTITLQG
jgi:hypothetical protein